ncbi:hypothetical protein HY632_03150 [Candidatus Uhrbacteria bacterium]|nr:hypothetical protein [Candidatus Uhrbacteria bacterium]
MGVSFWAPEVPEEVLEEEPCEGGPRDGSPHTPYCLGGCEGTGTYRRRGRAGAFGLCGSHANGLLRMLGIDHDPDCPGGTVKREQFAALRERIVALQARSVPIPERHEVHGDCDFWCIAALARLLDVADQHQSDVSFG